MIYRFFISLSLLTFLVLLEQYPAVAKPIRLRNSQEVNNIETAQDIPANKQVSGSIDTLARAISDRNIEVVKTALQQIKSDGKSTTTYLDRIVSTGEYYYNKGQFEEACRWYAIAANEGHAFGQSLLGYMYLNGRGVEKSDEEAVKWFQKSASQGNKWGQANLGYMYKQGRGVPKSKEEASRLLTLAASTGLYYAKEQLKELSAPEESPLFI